MATEAALLNKKQTHGKKKEKVCLDINRPSHGRTWPRGMGFDVLVSLRNGVLVFLNHIVFPTTLITGL